MKISKVDNSTLVMLGEAKNADFGRLYDAKFLSEVVKRLFPDYSQEGMNVTNDFDACNGEIVLQKRFDEGITFSMRTHLCDEEGNKIKGKIKPNASCYPVTTIGDYLPIRDQVEQVYGMLIFSALWLSYEKEAENLFTGEQKDLEFRDDQSYTHIFNALLKKTSITEVIKSGGFSKRVAIDAPLFNPTKDRVIQAKDEFIKFFEYTNKHRVEIMDAARLVYLAKETSGKLSEKVDFLDVSNKTINQVVGIYYQKANEILLRLNAPNGLEQYLI